ncbi:MAG: hypothetical protein WA687_12790 [Solirubrobacterales bacterium]
MEAVRESWTDERLDYLNHRVDDGFKQVDERFGRLESRVERIDNRLDDLNKTIIQFGFGMIATMLVGFLTVLATTL